MLDSIIIIIASSALFLYWFRYTCLLLLAQHSAEQALKVASTIRLSFPQIQDALQTNPSTSELDRLHQKLEYDYRTLTDLLGHARGADSIERTLLTMDFKVMRGWYKLTRSSNHLLGRNAIAEMCSILGYFAAEIAESSAA